MFICLFLLINNDTSIVLYIRGQYDYNDKQGYITNIFLEASLFTLSKTRTKVVVKNVGQVLLQDFYHNNYPAI